MANITEVSQWESVIRQIENGEAATGGADGLANVQAKQLANRTKWLKENCLPLTGGALTGTTICRHNDLGNIELRGGTNTTNSGAMLKLFSKGYSGNAGDFSLTANNGNNGSSIIGTADGGLTWNGKDLASSAIVAKSLGWGGYVKYASGLIIQWGIFDAKNGGNTVYNYPISFTNEPFISLQPSIGREDISTCELQLLYINKTNFTVKLNTTEGNKATKWFAIGY